MKELLFNKPYKPFLFTALATTGVALFLFLAYPRSLFDFDFYDIYLQQPSFKVWIWISVYLFFLSLIYYILRKAGFRPKKWLLLSHYIFILLFLLFFILVSSFTSSKVQDVVSGLTITSVLAVYGIFLLADITFLLVGLLLLFINLWFLKK